MKQNSDLDLKNILIIIIKSWNFLKDKDIGQNWAIYLEYGTRDMKEIELQNFGFSRYTANKLMKNYSNYVSFSEDNKFIEINLGIKNELDVNSIEYDEITKIIG